MSDPSASPVTVEVNGTAARLLVKLMAEMKIADSTEVLSRALGVMDTMLSAKRNGRRVGVYDQESGRFIDVAI